MCVLCLWLKTNLSSVKDTPSSRQPYRNGGAYPSPVQSNRAKPGQCITMEKDHRCSGICMEEPLWNSNMTFQVEPFQKHTQKNKSMFTNSDTKIKVNDIWTTFLVHILTTWIWLMNFRFWKTVNFNLFLKVLVQDEMPCLNSKKAISKQINSGALLFKV